ncbi:MAG: electron transfer flavoprotein subunit beta/FixA family protein [Clostridiales bacterium]|nr:electron transfer flavoprotein subunit beta/FixA family protein [Clostridiales bacterium]
MRIILCVKQVPNDGGAVIYEKDGTLVRSGGMLNPCDSHAASAAFAIKKAFGGEIIVLSMGAASAISALREVLAAGADRGVLLCGREFKGSDVYATSYALSQAVKKLGGADLILCGERTADGGTAQTPFSLAAQLLIPAAGFIKRIVFREGILFFIQELSGISVEVEARFPMLAAVSKQIAPPAVASLKGYAEAAKKEICIWDSADLPDNSPRHYGLTASPTAVRSIKPLVFTAKNPPIYETPKESAERLIAIARRFL